MVGKRMAAHILNKLLIFIPSLLLLGGISLVIAPNYFIFGKDESGWLMVYLYKYLIFLPTVFLDFLRDPSEYLSIIYIILPTLICLTVVDILTISLLKADLGMKILKLKIISTKNKPLSFGQITARTFLKYLSLAFFPFVLLFIFFDDEKKTMHDKLCYTRVVKVVK